MNTTHAVIGRCPWFIRVQIHGWHHEKLVSFVLFNSLEIVCEIIFSDTLAWGLCVTKSHYGSWCHFFVFTAFWRHLWSIAEEMHSHMESILESATKWTPLAVFPSYFSLRCSLCLKAWNGLVQGKKRLWTHNMIRINRTPPSLPPPPSSSKPCSEIYSLVSWMVYLFVRSFTL